MSQTELETETETDVDFPTIWGVKFMNDDYTPMDFVILVLVQVFGLSETDAAAITVQVHNDGQAVVGAYMKDIAFTKAITAENIARQHGHPLRLQPVEV